ncbi:MAG TPA: AAA family ATPase, partial [Myxococcota bacterium]
IHDEKEQSQIVAREAYRFVADLLADPDEQKLVFDSLMTRARFGVTVPPLVRATSMDIVTSKGRQYLQVGAARVPLRKLGEDPALDELIPPAKGLREPIGPQIGVIESLLLAWELKQPAAAVGITGTGKTMLMKVLARKLNWPVIEQNAHADMSKDDLLGAPALTKDRRVEFKKAPLNTAVDDGLLYILDEALTLDNDVREVTNPLTEGSELQIPSRPPRTISKQEWHPDFRFFMTTNGGDIRKADFSPAEASRLRIINFPEITDPKDFQAIAARDYLDASAKAAGVGAVDGKLTTAAEVKRAVDLFVALRELQRSSKKGTVSPITQRVFTSFMDVLASLRERVGFKQAVQRAAELTILSKLGPTHEKAALAAVADLVAQSPGKDDDEVAPSVPTIGDGETIFGDTHVKHGSLPALQPDNTQFPFTPARCHNLALCADALELGQGRPVSCNDDENGENVELWRQLGRLSGRPVTVVTLTKNVDIESLIEKLVPSASDGADAGAKGGFEPELQQIGEAVRQGHILVLRGCGNVPTTKLERLNSLGDGRQSLALPKSAPEVLSAHPDFRLVLMKKEGSPFDYSEAIQNRVLEPRLSTRAGGTSRLEQRAGELAGVVRERAGISSNAAMKLAAFHTYLNEVLKQGAFSSGRQVKSFLHRDAEAVAQRLAHLVNRGVGAGDDEIEVLHDLVLQVYGERFTVDGDRELLHTLAQRALGSEGGKLVMSNDAVRTPNLVRYGEWVTTADPLGVREGVPKRDDVLPPTSALGAVQQRMFAALQFGEVVHLHGDPLLTQAITASAARLLTSPVLEIDGNEGLAAAHLFGGLIQDQKTGKFERHEGAVWRAQRLGLMLVIKNASRIPDDVMLPLAEIAATKHLQRVVNGNVEHHACKFRLVLQTAATDPKPLVSDLAQLVTRVSCPQINDEPSVRQIVGHALLGVPGGPLLAGELSKLVNKVATLVHKEIITGRPELRFDAARTVEIAKAIARAVHAGASLESALADAINNQIFRPLTGLSALDKARALVSALGATLADAGTLEAEAAPAVDDVDNPAKAQLLKDYSEYSDVLTHAAVRAVVDAIKAHASSPQELRAVMRAASESRVLPQAARARLAKAAAAPGDIPVDTLATALQRMAPQVAGENDESFYEAILDFMRGARLSDVEHRTAIFGAYQSLFQLLGSPSAQAHAIELERVSERFDAANALATIETMRKKVALALDNYRGKSGEVDDHLARLFRELVETWDVVVMSPVFKEHHQLRQTIGELNQGLAKIVATLDKRGEMRGESGAAVARLVEEVRVAGAMIEGVRIAEQSAELRRDIVKSERATERIIDDLRGELLALRALDVAERRSKHLNGQHGALARLRGGDVGSLKNASAAVDPVSTRPDADLMTDARRQSLREAAPQLAARRAELLAQLQDKQKTPARGLANFFAGYAPDVARAADPSAGGRNREALAALEDTLQREGTTLVDERARALFAAAKKQELDRARKETGAQVESRVRQTASRVKNAAKDLRVDLASIARELELKDKDPALAAAVDEMRAALDDLGERA